MKLHSPFSIGSRLLPCLKISGVELSIEYHHTDREGRDVYTWNVDGLPTGEYGCSDLKSGCQGATVQEMFGTLLAFLSACGSAVRYERRPPPWNTADSADLFPRPVGEWAAEHSDEIESLQCEVEETETVLIEE